MTKRRIPMFNSLKETVDGMKSNCHGKLANRQGQQMMMMMVKKYSIANKIKVKYSIRNRREAARKFIRQQKKKKKNLGPSLQICKGKSILEPSNSHTYQMDVDQAPAVHFEEGIIMNILSRLPVRTLHQFKCVSKFWNALISDPYFKMKHFKHAKNDRNSQKFLITQMLRHENKFSSYCCPLSSVQMAEDTEKLARPLSSKPFFRAMCACDGLVVVIVSDIMDDPRPIHLLWNPSIRESIVLPAPESEKVYSTRYGFGYDSISGDYKILRTCSVSTEILALNDGFWRKIDKHPHGVRDSLFSTSSLAFVHGAFHWIGRSDYYSRVCSLVSFSISKEMYGEIPLSKEILLYFVGQAYVGVSVLDGMLCVNSAIGLGGFRAFKLWLLKDYGVEESWSALLTIEDPSIHRLLPKYRFADGELLFYCIYIPSCVRRTLSRKKILPCGGVFRTASGPFVSWLQAGLLYGEAFTESLISPKSLFPQES
ncbi:F-box/kelch-repeat protein isoform X1 [Capsicum annuum]|nr:F-box/kelch-repeat protein At3g23880 isoform X1 [Capsicum annuum]